MNIELSLNAKNENYIFKSGDIVRDKDGDLYLIVQYETNCYNLLGLTYGKGELIYYEGREHDKLTILNVPVKLVEKSENVTIEIKTKGE